MAKSTVKTKKQVPCTSSKPKICIVNKPSFGCAMVKPKKHCAVVVKPNPRCTTVKQISIEPPERCGTVKPKLCTGSKPRILCYNKPNSICTIKPVCSMISKPAQIKKKPQQ